MTTTYGSDWLRFLGRYTAGDERAAEPLTLDEAIEIESELRRLERNPEVSKRELRLFMQHPMPCGHAVGNLLTCDSPPFGCVVCGPHRAAPPPGMKEDAK